MDFQTLNRQENNTYIIQKMFLKNNLRKTLSIYSITTKSSIYSYKKYLIFSIITNLDLGMLKYLNKNFLYRKGYNFVKDIYEQVVYFKLSKFNNFS